jgi:hypothetical protein
LIVPSAWYYSLAVRVNSSHPPVRVIMTHIDSSSGPPFQFSLRWLLIVVTVVALLLGLMVMFGGGVFANVLLLLYPTPLVVTIVYAKGEVRTFAIGAVVPWLSLAFLGSSRYANWAQLETVLWMLFLAGLSGAVAVFTRRWLVRNGYGG